MDNQRAGVVARLRQVLLREKTKPDDATPPPQGPASGVPTPQQISSDRSGADPVWDC